MCLVWSVVLIIRRSMHSGSLCRLEEIVPSVSVCIYIACVVCVSCVCVYCVCVLACVCIMCMSVCLSVCVCNHVAITQLFI